MDQLEEEVDGIYRNFNQIFQPQEDSVIYCTSQTLYDEKRQSNTMEFATATPMNWPMRAAFNNVWTFLETSSVRG